MTSPLPYKKDVENWNVEQVAAYIHQMQFGDCQQAFLKRGIDGRALLTLDESNLMTWSSDLPIRCHAKIARLVREINNQRPSSSVSSTDTPGSNSSSLSLIGSSQLQFPHGEMPDDDFYDSDEDKITQRVEISSQVSARQIAGGLGSQLPPRRAPPPPDAPSPQTMLNDTDKYGYLLPNAVIPASKPLPKKKPNVYEHMDLTNLVQGAVPRMATDLSNPPKLPPRNVSAGIARPSKQSTPGLFAPSHAQRQNTLPHARQTSLPQPPLQTTSAQPWPGLSSQPAKGALPVPPKQGALPQTPLHTLLPHLPKPSTLAQASKNVPLPQPPKQVSAPQPVLPQVQKPSVMSRAPKPGPLSRPPSQAFSGAGKFAPMSPPNSSKPGARPTEGTKLGVAQMSLNAAIGSVDTTETLVQAQKQSLTGLQNIPKDLSQSSSSFNNGGACLPLADASDEPEWDQETVRLSNDAKDGGFVVRPSSRDHPLTLTLAHNGTCCNIGIRQRADQLFALGSEKNKEQAFSSVDELVEFYCKNMIKLNSGGAVMLTTSISHDSTHIYIRVPIRKGTSPRQA